MELAVLGVALYNGISCTGVAVEERIQRLDAITSV